MLVRWYAVDKVNHPNEPYGYLSLSGLAFRRRYLVILVPRKPLLYLSLTENLKTQWNCFAGSPKKLFSLYLILPWG
jgi:hypothetical protein